MENDTSTLIIPAWREGEKRDDTTLMIIPFQRYYPPLFDLFREQIDYFVMDFKPFNLLLKNIESGRTTKHRVLRVEGDFTIIFSKKVLDN